MSWDRVRPGLRLQYGQRRRAFPSWSWKRPIILAEQRRYLVAASGFREALRRWRRAWRTAPLLPGNRSEEHTSELQSLMRISYAVFCLKKKNKQQITKCNII